MRSSDGLAEAAVDAECVHPAGTVNGVASLMSMMVSAVCIRARSEIFDWAGRYEHSPVDPAS
jgi:hypothetical protein